MRCMLADRDIGSRLAAQSGVSFALHLHCAVQVSLSGSDLRAANVRALFIGRMSAIPSSRGGVVNDRLHRAFDYTSLRKSTFSSTMVGAEVPG